MVLQLDNSFQRQLKHFLNLYYTECILPVVQVRSHTHKGVLITLVAEVMKELYDTAIKSNDTKVTDAVAKYITKAKKQQWKLKMMKRPVSIPLKNTRHTLIYYFDDSLITHVTFIVPLTNWMTSSERFQMLL